MTDFDEEDCRYFGLEIEQEREIERLQELHRRNALDIRRFLHKLEDYEPDEAGLEKLLNKIENRSKAAITDTKETG